MAKGHSPPRIVELLLHARSQNGAPIWHQARSWRFYGKLASQRHPQHLAGLRVGTSLAYERVSGIGNGSYYGTAIVACKVLFGGLGAGHEPQHLHQRDTDALSLAEEAEGKGEERQEEKEEAA